MTLVEMMIVIVIIGILSGLAFVLLRGRPGLQETAHQITNQVREASRMAISGGIVDQSLVNVGSLTVPPNARTRVSIVYNATSGRQVSTVETRVEANDPDATEWLEVSSHALQDGIVVYGYANQIVLNNSGLGDAYGTGTGGGTGGVTMETLLGPTPFGGGAHATADIYFAPDGSVVTAPGDPLTLFILDTGGGKEKRVRVTVMPLQGQPMVFGGW